MPATNLFRILLAGALCAAAAFAVSLLPIHGLLRLALSVTAGGIVYVAVLALSGEIREELSAIKSFLKRRISV